MKLKRLYDAYDAANYAFYDGILPKITIKLYTDNTKIYDGKTMHELLGYDTYGLLMVYKNTTPKTLYLNRSLSGLLLVGTLYHEMIHAWQAVTGLNCLKHDKTFIKQAKRIAKILDIPVKYIHVW